MIWLLLILATYGVGWYLSSLHLGRRFNEANEERLSYRELDGADRRENVAIAMLVATLWPLVLPAFALHSAMVPRVGPTRRQLIDSTPPFSSVTDHLLANGVTVELPSEPLTSDAVDAVVTAAWTDNVNDREQRVRAALAPYVAKGRPR